MKILLVAATEMEINALLGISSSKHELYFLASGVGMVATTYSLSNYLRENKYDLAINCGVAGSFDRKIAIGEVVNVSEDIFSELGAEDGEIFLNLSEIGLDAKDSFKKTSTLILTNRFKSVKGITVNTIHGNETSINKIVNRMNPQIESMEGAAFFYVCEKESIPSLQLRSISNYIERRNREAWNIPLALKNLREAVVEVIGLI